MAPRNHAACVGSYCEAILSGEIIAWRYVELAVRRYLDDLGDRLNDGAGIDRLDGDGSADIVTRDNDDDVIGDDRDTIVFEASATFASASNWLDEV